MNKKEFMYAIDHPETLPERAYCTLPTDKTHVIIVVNGEHGYYPYQKYSTEEDAKNTCDYCNKLFGVTEEQKEALLILSMRGN